MLDSANFRPTTIQEARLAVVMYNFMKYRCVLVSFRGARPFICSSCVTHPPLPTLRPYVRADLESESMEPTMLPGGVVPLCMEQFRRLFSTTRLPGRECDTIKHWSATNQSAHVAVLCNGSFYVRASVCGCQRRWLCPPDGCIAAAGHTLYALYTTTALACPPPSSPPTVARVSLCQCRVSASIC